MASVFLKTFSRSAVASLAATVVDFGTLAIWVEGLHLSYPYGVALGAGSGAITNFLLNRHWGFEVGHLPIGRQAFRYALVSLGSLVLNTGGVVLLTEVFRVYYMMSKVVTALAVSWFYNYPLQRFFVYAKPHATTNL